MPVATQADNVQLASDKNIKTKTNKPARLTSGRFVSFMCLSYARWRIMLLLSSFVFFLVLVAITVSISIAVAIVAIAVVIAFGVGLDVIEKQCEIVDFFVV